jgi:hypothetical protein
LGYPHFAGAHRLDEYLQASRIEVSRDVVNLELDLTPGVDVAQSIIAQIDADNDGQISDPEGRAYAIEILRSASLSLDGRSLQLTLTCEQYPQVEDLKAGIGIIRIRAASKLPFAAAPGLHELFYRNVHRPEISVYLANALVPSDGRIQIFGQQRDYEQHELRIDYRFNNTEAFHSAWLVAGLVVAGIGGIGTYRWRRV